MKEEKRVGKNHNNKLGFYKYISRYSQLIKKRGEEASFSMDK